MAMKETIEEKLDRFIHVGWRDKALQNSHGVGKINIAGHAFHVPHRFQKLVIDTALKDSPQLFHFTADDIKIPALGLDLSQRKKGPCPNGSQHHNPLSHHSRSAASQPEGT